MADIIKVEAQVLEQCASMLTNVANELEHERGALHPGLIALGSIPNFVCNVIFRPVSRAHALVSLIRAPLNAGTITAALEAARSQLAAVADVAEDLSRRVRRVSELFDETENRLIYDVRSIEGPDPFDNIGQNGGNQGHPVDNVDYYDEFRRIIKENTGEELDDNELNERLNHMNSTGCSYVALVNAILDAYRGREAEFEETFGYPMYGPDGDFNFDALFVDIYSFANMNRGTFVSEQAQIISDFCNAHGVDVEVTRYSNQQLTADRYREMVANGEAGPGQIVISVGCPFSLTNMDGTPYRTWENGAHAMTVIGTQGDYLVVSSWGKTYLLDPSNMNNWNTGSSSNDYGYLVVKPK